MELVKLNLKLMNKKEIKLYRYYVAKMSFFKGNPIHEYIVFTSGIGKDYLHVYVFLGMSSEEVNVENLNYFEILREIEIEY